MEKTRELGSSCLQNNQMTTFTIELQFCDASALLDVPYPGETEEGRLAREKAAVHLGFWRAMLTDKSESPIRVRHLRGPVVPKSCEETIALLREMMSACELEIEGAMRRKMAEPATSDALPGSPAATAPH